MDEPLSPLPPLPAELSAVVMVEYVSPLTAALLAELAAINAYPAKALRDG